MSGKILAGTLKDSLLKFDPRYTVTNPVVFILYLCFIVTLLITLFPAEFSDIAGIGLDRTDYVVVAIILFLPSGSRSSRRRWPRRRAVLRPIRYGR
jgi:potassium-transporting ATPase ATP-binding subunit